QECLHRLRQCDGYNYIVVSGSSAPGIPPEFYSEIALIVKQKGARLIVDSSGDVLQQSLGTGIFLTKPNLGELSALSGVKELDEGCVADVARLFINKGECEVVVVSMGASGAMLITSDEQYHEAAPIVKIKST